MAQIFKNNTWGLLASQLTAGATSATLTAGHGFTDPGTDWYLATLIGVTGTAETSWEIVKVTDVSANTLTIVRAQEGTTAVTWPAGTRIELRLTAGATESKANLGTAAYKAVGTGSSDVAAGDHAHASLYQPLDSDLTALAGLSIAGLIERTGAGTAGIVTVTAAGKALLDDADAAAQRTTLGLGNAATANLLGPNAYFAKSDPTQVAWTKTGNGTAKLNQLLHVEVNGLILIIAADTAITMPSLTAGTNYAIWCKTDGALEASSNHVTPPAANARRIGGFHYAPGGNASAQDGGDTTPQINAYSFWDLKWRPTCPDPRGMTLVAGRFWADIYLCGVDHHTDGTSAYDKTIADGAAPPKIPAAFDGNGSTAYSDGNWWNFAEVMTSHGKRLPTYAEFAALAYGVKEAYSIHDDPIKTGLVNGVGSPGTGEDLNANKYTSKWGVIQASGNLWTWGSDFSYRTGSGVEGWKTSTGGRGSLYLLNDTGLVAAIFGGGWSYGVDSGSRASRWHVYPWLFGNGVSGRGVCDHLQLV